MPKPKKLTKKLKENEFYCVVCRSRVKCDNIKFKKIKNSKLGYVPALTGKDKYGDKLFKFVKWKDESMLKKKYV
jgi:hypothetical protein